MSARLFRPLLCVALTGLGLTDPETLRGQEMPRLDHWLTPGLDARAVTADNLSLELQNLRFETESDLSDAAQPWSFISESEDLRFTDIRRLEVNPVQREWIGSNPDLMQSYYLGPVGRPSPPPPDWGRSVPADHWLDVEPVETGMKTPFLGHARFVWAETEGRSSPDERGEYLFRQEFAIERIHEAASVRLRIAAGQTGFRAIVLNGRQVILPPDCRFEWAEFEIQTLIQPGRNLIGFHVFPLKTSVLQKPAFAFHVEITRVGDAERRSKTPRASALLSLRNGNRIRGRVTQLQPDAVEIANAGSTARYELERVESIVFPLGWSTREDEGGEMPGVKALRGLWPGGEKEKIEPAGAGAPLRFHPPCLPDGILMTDGRLTRTRPARMTGDTLTVTTSAGQEYALKIEEIQAIYPGGGQERSLRKPHPELAPLFCEISTRSGERMTGLLRQFNGRKVVLETDGSAFFEYTAGDVADIYFPYHFRSPAAPKTRAIAIMSPPAESGARQDEYERLSRECQQAAIMAGLQTEILPLEALADRETLNPDLYPLLVCLDPVGEFLDTYREESDARNALRSYVESGGAVLLYSRTGAWRIPVVGRKGRFIRTMKKPSLTSEMNIAVIHPLEPTPFEVAAFDRPPNTGIGLEFRLKDAPSDMPATLPLHFTLPMAEAAPYYPMMDERHTALHVYELVDSNGSIYGPALSILERGRGRILIVNHLLWDAQHEGIAFHRIALPQLLLAVAENRHGDAEKQAKN